MADSMVTLVRQAIFTVLDERAWDFTDDEQRVDFADRVLTFIPATNVQRSETKPPIERLMERQMAESPVFLPRAIELLNQVKAWRDDEGNDGFPHDVREGIDALLMAYELREQEKRRG